MAEALRRCSQDPGVTSLWRAESGRGGVGKKVVEAVWESMAKACSVGSSPCHLCLSKAVTWAHMGFHK